MLRTLKSGPSEAIMSLKRSATIGSSLLCGVAIAALLLCVQLPASAQTWTVIHTFSGLGGGSAAGLTRDAAGNFYGTTVGGGSSGVPHFGTVFKLTHQGSGWVFTTLYRFDAFDGDGAASRVMIGPDGALYGTTSFGGNGYGIVYRLQPPVGCRSANCPWTETVLYAFLGGSDGWNPSSADLAFDRQGNIYGTTVSGGLRGCYETCGVVFKLNRSGGSWNYSVIYSFQGGNNGGNPNGGVVVDGSGNLFGTAGEGGYYSRGVVFELTPSGSGWTQTTLLAFPDDDSLGAAPESGLLMDSSGILYGTTPQGGQYGAGTVYEVGPGGGGGLLASLPYMAGNGSFSKLAMDNHGHLYGTAWLGNVFKLTPFRRQLDSDSIRPGHIGMTCSLVVDSSGAVYGTDPATRMATTLQYLKSRNSGLSLVIRSRAQFR